MAPYVYFIQVLKASIATGLCQSAYPGQVGHFSGSFGSPGQAQKSTFIILSNTAVINKAVTVLLESIDLLLRLRMFF